MDDGENLLPNTDEKKTLQGMLSESLTLLEKLENDLTKRRSSRKKADVSTEDSTNQQERSISPNNSNSSRECSSILEEIKSTETGYVSKLEGHIAVYIYAIKHYESQEIKQDSVKVSNILNDLLQLQVKFANTLKSTNQLEEMLKLFYDYEPLFHTYKSFFMKDQKFHSIQIKASSSKDDQVIDISLGAFLFQRLVQYKNLFEALQRATTDPDSTKLIGKTLEIISEILNECNKKLVLEKINLGPISKSESTFRPQTVLIGNCPLDHYNEYGTYYFENQFIEAGKTVTLHLFSKVILVTKKENGEQRIYQKHIKMTEVRLGPEKKNPKILVLEDFQKLKETGNLTVYEFEANFKETCIDWKTKIREILQRQLHTCKSVVELKTRHSN